MGAPGWGMGGVEFCGEAVVVGSIKYDLAPLLRHSRRSGASLGGGRRSQKGMGRKTERESFEGYPQRVDMTQTSDINIRASS